MKCRGLKVAAQKLDPYINVDPGTMSPYQHGEVFVTDDGAETDLDLGHYERFIDENLNKYSNLTTGKVYWNVLNQGAPRRISGRARSRSFPISPTRSKRFIYSGGRRRPDADVVITEIGGTTGDIECQPVSGGHPPGSASRWGGKTVCSSTSRWCRTSNPAASTRQSPHSIPSRSCRALGIMPEYHHRPRATSRWRKPIRQKIALFCNVKPDCVIENLTVPVLYEAPLMLEQQPPVRYRVPRAASGLPRPAT